MSLRWHVEEADRVVCCRIIGTFNDDTGLRLIRQYFERHPLLIRFNQIYDVRRWAGVVTDDALATHFQWGVAFHEALGAHVHRPRNIYLAEAGAGAGAIVDQLSRLRGAPMDWATDPAAAWALAAPEAPLPAAVARFFKGR